MGAWMYLGIVFIIPLSLGVFALVTDLPISTDEALQGLVMPASAYVLLGKGGAVQSDIVVLCPDSLSHAQPMPICCPIAGTALHVLVAWLVVAETRLCHHSPAPNMLKLGAQERKTSETFVTLDITFAGAVLVIIMIFMAGDIQWRL